MEVQQNSREFNLFSFLQWPKSLLAACLSRLSPACRGAESCQLVIALARCGLPQPPFQFVSENGEVVFLARLYQGEGEISLFDADYIPCPQLATHLSIAGQGDIVCLGTDSDFNMGVAWQHDRTIGQGEFTDGGQDDALCRGINYRTTGREIIRR